MVVAIRFGNNVLSNETILHKRVAGAGTREVELLSGASMGSGQVIRTTAELCHALDTTSTKSRKSSKISGLNMNIESLNRKVVFYQLSKEHLKAGFLEAAAECTRLGGFFH